MLAKISANWNNEAYVSLHLVQKMIQMAGLPAKSEYSHWYPEFKIKVPKLSKNGHISNTEKEYIQSSNLNKIISRSGCVGKLDILPSGYAKQIASNRPYSSQEDMQKKLGEKRSLNWLRAYKQINL